PPPALPSPQEAQPSEPASLAPSPDDPVRDTVPGAPPQAEEAFFAGGDLGVRPTQGSTMQGTETTLEAEESIPRPPQARRSRFIAILACALAVTPIVIFGGRRLGGFGVSASNDTIDATLDEARDAMRRRAWDAPPGHNFKEITAQAMARWPDN